MFKKTMAMALAGLMLTSMAGTTALTAKAENDDVMELTMYFPVSVGGGPDALIDALCEEYHAEDEDGGFVFYANPFARGRREQHQYQTFWDVLPSLSL